MCEMFEGGKGLCEDSICLQDFCGRGKDGFQTNFWADWCPHDKVVYFGGAWGFIPNLLAETEPSDDIWGAWVEKHEKIHDDEINNELMAEAAVRVTPEIDANASPATVGSVMKIIGDMHRFDQLGGRDTLFGRAHIFEYLLHEEHEKVGKTSSENGMYRFKGIAQYGNIVDYEPTKIAMNRFISDYGFTSEDLGELEEYYNGQVYLGAIDCAVLGVLIKHEVAALCA